MSVKWSSDFCSSCMTWSGYWTTWAAACSARSSCSYWFLCCLYRCIYYWPRSSVWSSSSEPIRSSSFCLLPVLICCIFFYLFWKFVFELDILFNIESPFIVFFLGKILVFDIQNLNIQNFEKKTLDIQIFNQ